MPYLVEAEALYRKGDDRFGLGWAVHTLGLVALGLGDLGRARNAWTEALELFHAAGDVSGLVLQLDNFSALAQHEGDFIRAARLYAAANSLQESTGMGLARIARIEEHRDGRVGLTEEEARQARADGQALSLDEAVAYALEGAARASIRDG